MRRGDFSDALNNNGSLQLIYDPRTGDMRGTRTNGVCRQRHPGGSHQRRSPGGSTSSTRCRTDLGTPTTTSRNSSARFDRNQYDVKINWNRSPAHQIWGKIGVMDATVSNLQKLSFDGGGLGKTKTWVGDDRPDLHAQPIARHRHDLRLFAPRPVGVRPGLRHQLRPGARRARHERPGHPPERHAGLGQRHERAGLDRQLESLHAVRSDLHGGRQRHEACRRALVPVRRGRSTSSR